MPTPVATARQCLTEEAARALDEAVAVARRRSHVQTTSLHAVSAMLSLPSSALRDACSHARSSAYSSRLQFRALELCVGVSLDRLASTKAAAAAEEVKEPPPVSNSLMAAIRRSQANQRRHPENFHLQQMHSNQQTASFLKVELKYFILSILDDPIVSRLFGDAGFTSYDIKMAILHPPITTSFTTSSRITSTTNRCPPPIFLCNLTDPTPSNINCTRIADSFVRNTGKKNQLLVGACASDALNSFVECVDNKRWSLLPHEISGLGIVSVEMELGELVCDKEDNWGFKFDKVASEVSEKLRDVSGPGVVVSIGDLKGLIEDGVSSKAVGFVVSELTRLMEESNGKVWLIAVVSDYEVYLKFVARFPSVEKDWELHPLPITSSKPVLDGFINSKSSFMGSFIPFGGFFPSSELKNPLLSINQPVTRCHLCNEKYEQEVAAIMNVGSTSSVADKYSENLSPWLQPSALDTSKGLETKGDRAALNSKILALQKKWNDKCQQVHHPQLFPKLGGMLLARPQVPPGDSFRFVADSKSNSKESSLSPTYSKTTGILTDTQNIPLHRPSMLIPKPSGAENLSVLHDSPCSSFVVPVTTDLGLGTLYTSTSQESNSPKLLDNRQSSCSSPTFGKQFHFLEYKTLKRNLLEKVSWQDEAIVAISQALSRCRNGNGKRRGQNPKGDIWLTFMGPDKVGKKKIAAALAEITFGSQESLIFADLSSHDRVDQSNTVFQSKEQNNYDLQFRGKTVVDYITSELRKRQSSVVFLENVDKADLLAQASLSKAIRTGKFPDSHGREISINNTIFILTSAFSKNNDPEKKYSEDCILGAKNRQMQLQVGRVYEDSGRNKVINVRIIPRKEISNPLSACSNKRKLSNFLDLNLPVEDMEQDIDDDYDENNPISGISEAWLQDFLNHVDESVVFKPFDFDSLADDLVRRINLRFQRIFGSEALLDIEYDVILQILAAAWLSDREKVEGWVDDVLTRMLHDAQQQYNLNAQSVVKLQACDGTFLENEADSVRLPTKIILN
ncbi:hypothetical protein ACFE04_016162 [Oxalis oulophora]